MVKESVTGANTEPLTKIHPILLGKQKPGGAGLLARHRQQAPEQEDGNTSGTNDVASNDAPAWSASQVGPLSERIQKYRAQQQSLLQKQLAAQQLARASYSNFVTAEEKENEAPSKAEANSDFNNNSLNGVHSPSKRPLVPGLTLHLLDPSCEAELKNDPLMVELGGWQVFIIVESCRRSNIEFMFKTLSNGRSTIHQLVLANRVVAACCGTDVVRADVAKKALETLRGRQPVRYKPMEDKPLGRDDMIQGLILFFESSTELKSGEHYGVINKSCDKSKLMVEWWDANNNIKGNSQGNSSNNNNSNSDGSTSSDMEQVIMLLIKRRLVSVGRGCNYQAALHDCAEKALSFLLECNHLYLLESEMTLEVMAEFEATMSNLNGSIRNNAPLETGEVEAGASTNGNSDELKSPQRGLMRSDVGKIDENNVGHRLLCKMGWKGSGGIGKNEDGIPAPVEAKGHVGKCKRGIGLEPPPVAPPVKKKRPLTKITNLTQSVDTVSSTSTSHGECSKSLPAQVISPTTEELIPGFALRLPCKTTLQNRNKMNTKTKRKYIDKSLKLGNSLLKLEHLKNIHNRLTIMKLYINSILVTVVEAKNIAEATASAYEKCFDLLIETQPVIYDNGETSSSACNNRTANSADAATSSTPLANATGVSGLVLLLPTKKDTGKIKSLVPNYNEYIIRESCAQSTKPLRVDEDTDSGKRKSKCRCTVFIDEVLLATAHGKSFETAKRTAFQLSYSKLKADPYIKKEFSSRIMPLSVVSNTSIRQSCSPGKKAPTFQRSVSVVQGTVSVTTAAAASAAVGAASSSSSASSLSSPAITPATSAAATSTGPVASSTKWPEDLIPGLTLYLPYPGCMTQEQDVAKIVTKSCSRIRCPFDVILSNRPTPKGIFSAELHIQGKLISAGYGKEKPRAIKDAFLNGVYILMNRQSVVYENMEDNCSTGVSDEMNNVSKAGDTAPQTASSTSPTAPKEEGTEGQAEPSSPILIDDTDSSLSPSSVSSSDSDSDFDVQDTTPAETPKVNTDPPCTIPGLVLHIRPHETAGVVLLHSCAESNLNLKFMDSTDNVITDVGDTSSSSLNDGDQSIHCAKVMINDVDVAFGFGASSRKAKFDAAENALRLLIESGQPTVYENKPEDSSSRSGDRSSPSILGVE